MKPIVMGGQVKSKKDKKDSNGKMSLKYFERSVYDIDAVILEVQLWELLTHQLSFPRLTA